MAKQSTNAQQGVTWDTVSLPISQGVDLRSNDRARPVAKLAKLVNGSFEERNSVVKRAGYAGGRVKFNAPYFQEDMPAEARWIYGHGTCDPFLDTDFTVSAVQRELRGVVTRGDQVAAWTGDRLISYNAAGGTWEGTSSYWDDNDMVSLGVPLYAPQGKVQDIPISASSFTQLHTSARGTKYILTAWVATELMVRVETDEGTVILGDLEITTGFDSTGGAQTIGGANRVKAMYLDGHLGVVVGDNIDDLYWVHSSEEDPSQWFIEPLGEGLVACWDVAKVSDNLALLLARRTGDTLHVTYFDHTGALDQPATAGQMLDLGPQDATGACALAISGRGEFFGVVFVSDVGGVGFPWVQEYFASGNVAGGLGDPINLVADSVKKLTMCSLVVGPPPYTYVAYAEADIPSTDPQATYVICWKALGAAVDPDRQELRWGLGISSHAFSVGNEAFCVHRSINAANSDVNQSTYILLGGVLNPRVAGFWARQAACEWPSAGPGGPPVVIPGGPSGVDLPRFVDFLPGQDQANRTKWVVGMSHEPRYFRGRQDNRDEEVVVENRGLRADMDFLPEPVFAEAGQSTYVAGMAVQQWDGDKVHEAGFVQWPEHVTDPTASNTADGAMNEGTFRYRVYFCRRNRHGEVSRSPAITSAEVSVVAPNDTVTLTLTTLSGTSDPDVYYEIYRTEDSGDTFKLISGFRADSAVQNDRTSYFVTYVDEAPDSAISGNPADPHNPSIFANPELEEVAPPGCTVIQTIEDRMFWAGGIVPPGSVFYSKLFEPSESVAWNDQGVLEYTLDRGSNPVTAVGSRGGSVVVFRANEIFTFNGDGPDNAGVGFFGLPRRVSTDLGAISPYTALAPDGLAFWSADGPRVLTDAQSVALIGDEVQPLTKGRTLRAVLVAAPASQLRFYLDNGKVAVYDYATRFWATHTGLLCVNAAVNRTTGLAVLCKPDGRVLFEDPDVFQDAGRPFEYVFRTAELRRQELLQGATRYRRWAATGAWRGPHDLTVTVYQDGSPFYSERHTWPVAGDLDDTIWGDPDATGTFGSTGDTLWVGPTVSSSDGVYRVRRRFDDQKAASVSLEFSDRGAAGDSFVITELALELGVKDGLTRLPARGI